MAASIKAPLASSDHRVLFGWKQIAGFLNAGVRTAQRYERLHGLPVRRPAGKSKAAVMTTVAELEGWVTTKPVTQAFRLQPKVAAMPVLEELRSGMQTMRRLRDEMSRHKQELQAIVIALQANIPLGDVGPSLTLHTTSDSESARNSIEIHEDLAAQ